MHGKCLNYKVFYKNRVVLIFIWVYLQYNWKVEEKPGQGSAMMLRQALPGSHWACLAREVPLYLAELLLCFTSGAECWRGSAAQQLALICPRWWYLRNRFEQCLHYVLFGFCKIPSWYWKTRVISQDSPRLAGRIQHCVLEKWVLGMKGEQGEVLGREVLGRRRQGTFVGKAHSSSLRVCKRCHWRWGHSSLTDLIDFRWDWSYSPFPFSHQLCVSLLFSCLTFLLCFSLSRFLTLCSSPFLLLLFSSGQWTFPE